MISNQYSFVNFHKRTQNHLKLGDKNKRNLNGTTTGQNHAYDNF